MTPLEAPAPPRPSPPPRGSPWLDVAAALALVLAAWVGEVLIRALATVAVP